jgi:hypothetical protein
MGSEEFDDDDVGAGGRAHIAASSGHRITYKWDNSITVYNNTEVRLNNSPTFRNTGSYRWNDNITATTTNWNEWHVATVVKHELGHTFGLDHNAVESIMNVQKIIPGDGTQGVYHVQEDYDGYALYWLNFYWIEPDPDGIEDYIAITEGPTVIHNKN